MSVGIDGGELGSEASTVVAVRDGQISVLRQGIIDPSSPSP